MVRRTRGPRSSSDEQYLEPWDRPLAHVRWMTVHNLYRGGAIAVTLVVAAFAVTTWWQGAWNQIAPNDRVYDRLRQLSAGMSVQAFDRALGPASIARVQTVMQVEPGGPVTTAFTMRIYMEDQYVVTTLATDDQQTVLYSVLSCNEQFEPSFITPDKSTIRLRTAPISRSLEARRDPSAAPSAVPTPVAWLPTVLFQSGSTGGSPGIYAEIPVSVPSGVTHERTYGFGVNEACGDIAVTTASGADVTDYNVPTIPNDQPRYSKAEAEAALGAYRQRTEPNFYFETARGFTPPIAVAGDDAGDGIAQTLAIISPNDDEFPARYAVEQLGQ
jgi:hypothetical protein